MSRTTSSENKPGFVELIPNYNDEELLQVLKRRSHYREEAAQLAIHEAIKRGIISSEQDLSGEQFREEELHFTWFPVPHKPESRKKIKKSILRNLFITGFIPVIYGLVQIFKGKDKLAETAVVFGLVWLVLAMLYSQRNNKLFLRLLGIITVAGSFWLFQKLLSSGAPFIEFFVLTALVLMVIYGLLFLHFIDKRDNKT